MPAAEYFTSPPSHQAEVQHPIFELTVIKIKLGGDYSWEQVASALSLFHTPSIQKDIPSRRLCRALTDALRLTRSRLTFDMSLSGVLGAGTMRMLLDNKKQILATEWWDTLFR